MARSRRRKLPADPVITTIDSLSHDGRGVAHIDGKAVFIHGALPGEEVSFRYTRKRRSFDEGRAQTVLKPSPERVEPGCLHFDICGGCSLQHQAPAAQILAKQQLLLDAFERIGKVEPALILKPLTTGDPWGYRKKARLGVKYVPKKDKVLVGFRERGSSFLADIRHCPVLDPQLGNLLTPLSEMIGELSIRERVPQIEVAVGDRGCVLIFRLLEPSSEADRGRLLAFGQEWGVAISLQEGGPDTVTPLSTAGGDLCYALPKQQVNIRFLPTDFTQINSGLNQLMVARAMELLDPRPGDRLLDLFCGLGNFTLPLARRAGSVVGIEGDEGLVERARQNARENDIHNVRYYAANLYDSLEQEPWLTESFDKALLDPPRTGAVEVLGLLPKLGVGRILYVSCYPDRCDGYVSTHGPC
jgi:23S rRNA (uracil1939-C5)-methyltransferase